MRTDQRALKGTIWSMVERFSTMGVQLLCTLVIAQFLTPAEFGLVSMMSIFLSFSMLIVDSGFSQALIREKEVTQKDYSTVFWFNILLGIIVYGICWSFAPLIARFYGEPQLTSLVRWSFLSIIFLSLTVVQQARLFREVDFAQVSKVSIVSVFVSGIAGVVTAAIYKNVWSLIVQSFLYAFVRVVMFWHVSQWRPSFRFSFTALRKYFSFSMNLLGSRLIAAITDNLANLLVGKRYSAAELGNYTIPNKLQTSIAGTLSYSIHRVSYPIMSTFQDDKQRLKDYSQKVIGMAFYVISPIMLLLMICSEDFFSIILSEQWAEAAVYFKYLSFIGMICCFADVNIEVLLIRGKSRRVLFIEIVRKTILVVSLIIGIQYDMKVFLQLQVAYYLFNAIYVSYCSGNEICCNLKEQGKNILPTLFCLLIAGVAAYSFVTGISLKPLPRFTLSLVIVAVSYLGASIMIGNRSYKFLESQLAFFIKKKYSSV